MVDRTGKDDYYSYDEIDFNPSILRSGDHQFSIFSTTKEHQAEVNWPGPVVLLQYPRADHR